jgi:hypothetical protein
MRGLAPLHADAVDTHVAEAAVKLLQLYQPSMKSRIAV